MNSLWYFDRKLVATLNSWLVTWRIGCDTRLTSCCCCLLQSFYWMAKCLKSACLAFVCIVVSTCVTHWLFLEEDAIV